MPSHKFQFKKQRGQFWERHQNKTTPLKISMKQKKQFNTKNLSHLGALNHILCSPCLLRNFFRVVVVFCFGAFLRHVQRVRQTNLALGILAHHCQMMMIGVSKITSARYKKAPWFTILSFGDPGSLGSLGCCEKNKLVGG